MDCSCNNVNCMDQCSIFKMSKNDIVANFIRENIIFQFDIPKHLLSHNGTLFVNVHVQLFLNVFLISSCVLYASRNWAYEIESLLSTREWSSRDNEQDFVSHTQ